MKPWRMMLKNSVKKYKLIQTLFTFYFYLLQINDYWYLEFYDGIKGVYEKNSIKLILFHFL